jgi:hypothetical protein
LWLETLEFALLFPTFELHGVHMSTLSLFFRGAYRAVRLFSHNNRAASKHCAVDVVAQDASCSFGPSGSRPCLRLSVHSVPHRPTGIEEIRVIAWANYGDICLLILS